MSSTTTVTKTKTSVPVKRFPSSTPLKVRTRAQRRLNPSPVKGQQPLPPPPTTPKTRSAVLQQSNRLPFVLFTFTPHREIISMPPKPLAKRKNTKTQKAADGAQTKLTFPNAPAAVRKRPSSPSLGAKEGRRPKRLRTEVCLSTGCRTDKCLLCVERRFCSSGGRFDFKPGDNY
jgi:hypothetical protein